MAVEEGGQQGNDPPRAVSGRQGDAQDAGQPVGAAGGVLRVVDRRERFAGAFEQRLARRGQRNLPGRPGDELDAEAALERRDRARGGGLRQAEGARRLREISGLDGPDEQGELLQPVIHSDSEYIKCGNARYAPISA